MSIEPNIFQLFKDNEKLEEGLSDNFIEILKKCSNPHLINIYGDDKFGKGPIINQIINGTNSSVYFDLKHPFETMKELNIIKEKKYNIYGPIKIIDIIKNNNIDENKVSKVLNKQVNVLF